MPESRFVSALNEQIAYEFGASQQYTAIAVHYDSETLPRLAAFFYRQALEERNHAMMMVQYLLDAGERVTIPGIEAPRPPLRTRSSRSRWRSPRSGGSRADQRPRRRRARGERLCRRAVHALVHQGAGRGGVEHERPPARGRACPREPAPGRGVPGPRGDRRGATPPRRRPRAVLFDGGPTRSRAGGVQIEHDLERVCRCRGRGVGRDRHCASRAMLDAEMQAPLAVRQHGLIAGRSLEESSKHDDALTHRPVSGAVQKPTASCAGSGLAGSPGRGSPSL